MNHELTLVPFIDFLLCIVAFLLVTAVWSQMSRVNAAAAVPGAPAVPTDVIVTPPPELHVDMRHEDRFLLEWRQHGAVLSQITVPRSPAAAPEGVIRYPSLATQVSSSWERTGAHRAATDGMRDRAVLHAGNTAPFEEVIAAMDAIHAARRPFLRGETAAFDVVFAVD